MYQHLACDLKIGYWDLHFLRVPQTSSGALRSGSLQREELSRGIEQIPSSACSSVLYPGNVSIHHFLNTFPP